MQFAPNAARFAIPAVPRPRPALDVIPARRARSAAGQPWASRHFLRDVGNGVVRHWQDAVHGPCTRGHGRRALARLGLPQPQVLQDAPHDMRIVDQRDDAHRATDRGVDSARSTPRKRVIAAGAAKPERYRAPTPTLLPFSPIPYFLQVRLLTLLHWPFLPLTSTAMVKLFPPFSLETNLRPSPTSQVQVSAAQPVEVRIEVPPLLSIL